MKNMRELRIKMGLSMKKLGGMVGCSESTISQYETGKREPNFETLLKIAETLGCSTDYLLSGINEKKPAPISESELDAVRQELIDLYDSASPELQTAVLAALRSRAAGDKGQDNA